MNIKSEQEIILTKWIGLKGTYIISETKRDELLTKYTRAFINGIEGFKELLCVDKEIKLLRDIEVSSIYTVKEGGIFGALWEMADINNIGLSIDLKKIPLKQETVEVCEFYNLNPYMLFSDGCLLIVTDKGNQLVSQFINKGIPATIIGNVNNMKQRLVINNNERRYLTPPKKDEIYKIINEYLE